MIATPFESSSVEMSSPGRSRAFRLLTFFALATACGGVWWLLVSQVGDARGASRLSECKVRLRIVGNAFVEDLRSQSSRRDHSKEENDIVLHAFPPASPCCPLANPSESGNGYYCLRQMPKNEVGLVSGIDDKRDPFVIIAHAPDLPHTVNSRTYYPVLFSNGGIISVECTRSDYNAWFTAHFLKASNKLPPHQGDLHELLQRAP